MARTGLSKVGHGCPWGFIQSVEPIGEGLQWVDTPGHGGLELSEARQAELRAALPGFQCYGGNSLRWLEEDSDWTAAALVWPDLFGGRAVRDALRAVARGHLHGVTAENVPAGIHPIAANWLAEHANHWEEVGGSSGPCGAWDARYRRVGDGAERVVRFPSIAGIKRMATGAELDDVDKKRAAAMAG